MKRGAVTRAYHHLFTGQLPGWIHVEIHEEGSTKWLTVHSRIHVNKCVKIGPDYSSAFLDQEILKDLSCEIRRRFLDLTTRRVSYV